VHPPPIVPLSELITLAADGLSLDRAELFARITAAEEVNNRPIILPLSSQEKKQLIRRQLKEELHSLLDDEVLVAAYREHGSYRKAAAALTAQCNVPITKDQVYWAVQRCGGIRAVSRLEDSFSVRRTVASQGRDKKKIFTKYS
jgi:hypothetical protein